MNTNYGTPDEDGSNNSAHADMQRQVAASRRVLRAGGLGR